MSKVNGVTGHEKEKARHSLRRFENKKIKEDRISNCKNWIYGRYVYQGYYLKDHKRVGIRKTITIPAHDEWKKTFVGYETKVFKEWNEDTLSYEDVIEKYHPVFHNVLVHYPEKTVNRRVHTEYVPIPERPKRVSCRAKKGYRVSANRSFRRKPITEDNYNRGLYKKNFEIRWMLF